MAVICPAGMRAIVRRPPAVHRGVAQTTHSALVQTAESDLLWQQADGGGHGNRGQRADDPSSTPPIRTAGRPRAAGTRTVRFMTLGTIRQSSASIAEDRTTLIGAHDRAQIVTFFQARRIRPW
jgi:hypothetical protein